MNLNTDNTMIRKSPFTVLLVLTGLLLMTSCYDHKELVYSGPADVTVRFDWSAAPDASPASMRVVAFAEGAQPVTFPLPGAEGGSIVLPSSVYHFVSYNSDNENVYGDGDTWDSYRISAKTTKMASASAMFASTRDVPRARGTSDQPVVMEPGHVWASSLPSQVLSATRDNTLLFAMQPATHIYHISISNVQNVNYVDGAAMTISGVSGGYVPASGLCTDSYCTVPFECTIDRKTGALSGTVLLFGHCEYGMQSDHMLVVYVAMKDGTKWYYTFNITASMHDENHITDGGTGRTEIPIRIDDLPLPDPITNGSGLHPEVGEWQEIVVPIPL